MTCGSKYNGGRVVNDSADTYQWNIVGGNFTYTKPTVTLAGRSVFVSSWTPTSIVAYPSGPGRPYSATGGDLVGARGRPASEHRPLLDARRHPGRQHRDAADERGPAEFFEIRFVGPDHVLRRIDPSKLRSEGNPIPSGVLNEPQTATCTSDPGDEIDVLVLFTPKASKRGGGADAMRESIRVYMAEANLANTQSLVSTRFRLVGAEEMPYEESGHPANDLSSLQRPGGDARRRARAEGTLWARMSWSSSSTTRRSRSTPRAAETRS